MKTIESNRFAAEAPDDARAHDQVRAAVTEVAPGSSDTEPQDGAMRPSGISSRPPLPIPGARIVHDGILARGGMGAIHRVFDRHIRRHAAMKVLDEEIAVQPHARARFLAEAQIAGQLDHPNIVPVYDLDLDDGGAPRHFTMKLVEGVTLASVLRAEHVAVRGDDELFDLLQAFVRVCDAVAFAHSRGVVHRDLKPDNIMLGTYGQVYVMDWGIARVMPPRQVDGQPPPRSVSIDDDEEREATGTIIGSAQYMAPEQAWGRIDEIDPRTDVFALGGILYQMLTGAPPYRGSTARETLQMARDGLVRPPAEVAGGRAISPPLASIAMKALARAREDRYANVEAMKRDVERVLRGGLWLGSRAFAPGEIILREGDPPDAAYIITSGKAIAYKTVDGEPRTLREMGPGEVFGEMALLTSRPRTATVAAVDEVTALVVTREALARELHAESWLAALVRTLVERLYELDVRANQTPP